MGARRGLFSFLSILVCVFAAGLAGAETKKKDLENLLYMELKTGRVVIKLRPDLAPKHVERVSSRFNLWYIC